MDGRKGKECGVSYTLKVEPRGNYLYITVTGDNSVETVSRYLSEVRALCLQHNCPNVLIVENLTGPSLDTFSIYDLIARKSEETAQVFHRIAYVDLNPLHNSDAMKFAENVAVNRGVPAQVFSTIADAEKWLESQVKA
jgi:hypothetical protein